MTQKMHTLKKIQYDTGIARPDKVAIIGAGGTCGRKILVRAEEIGVEAVVVTRSPRKFKDVAHASVQDLDAD